MRVLARVSVIPTAALFISGGKSASGARVLSEAAVSAMMTPTTSLPLAAPQWGMGDRWGLGPTTSKWGDTAAWGHGGSARGGSSLLLWFPDKRAVLAFTVNSPTVIEPFTIRMTGDFAAALLGVRAPTQPLPPAKPIKVDRPQLYAGTYTRAGVRIEIAQQDGRLQYKEFNVALAERYKEMNQKADGGQGAVAAIVDEALIPLGDDRFLVKFPGFANGISVFFFGTDAQGRATNINSGLRTSRRTSSF